MALAEVDQGQGARDRSEQRTVDSGHHRDLCDVGSLDWERAPGLITTVVLCAGAQRGPQRWDSNYVTMGCSLLQVCRPRWHRAAGSIGLGSGRQAIGFPHVQDDPPSPLRSGWAPLSK